MITAAARSGSRCGSPWSIRKLAANCLIGLPIAEVATGLALQDLQDPALRTDEAGQLGSKAAADPALPGPLPASQWRRGRAVRALHRAGDRHDQGGLLRPADRPPALVAAADRHRLPRSQRTAGAIRPGRRPGKPPCRCRSRRPDLCLIRNVPSISTWPSPSVFMLTTDKGHLPCFWVQVPEL